MTSTNNMDTATYILSNMWVKGNITHESNYCTSLSSSLSTGMEINFEDNAINIRNPRQSVSLSVQNTSQLSVLETYSDGIYFGEANISRNRINNISFPWIEDNRRYEIFSEDDVDKYAGIVATVLTAFLVFAEGYPDEEIDYDVWTNAIQEILGESI